MIKVDTRNLKNVIATAVAASKETSRAMISAGSSLQKLIKGGMKQQAPGGEGWPKAHPWTRMASLRNRYVRRTRTWGRTSYSWTERKRAGRRQSWTATGGKQPLAKLAGAVRYQKFIETGNAGGVADTLVKIGFLTPKAAKLAAYAASGPHTINVTSRMRRLIFAAGLYIRSGTITVPQRRHVEPVYERQKDAIAAFVQRRVADAMSSRSGGRF